MGLGSTLSFMLLMMLPSSSGAKKGSVNGSCSAIVSEESGKGVCEVVTWSSVMNAVVVTVVDEYQDNMSVYHSGCMCNSGWCVGSSTVLSQPVTSPLRKRQLCGYVGRVKRGKMEHNSQLQFCCHT